MIKRMILLLTLTLVLVMVAAQCGGAPATDGWADDIGADGYADNAVAAVHKANELLS